MDPKSIVCEHFRAGQCTKGHKCKYSHDLNVDRKTAKAAVFDEDEGKEVRLRAVQVDPMSARQRLGQAMSRSQHMLGHCIELAHVCNADVPARQRFAVNPEAADQLGHSGDLYADV